MFRKVSQLDISRIPILYPHEVRLEIPGRLSSSETQQYKAEITAWTRGHAEDDYTHFLDRINRLVYAFKSKNDAFAFRMRWS